MVLVPTAAFADDEITIDHVESDGGVINVLLSVDHLPAGVTADTSSVEVAVEGRTVDATTKTVAAGDIERSTMLVLDASNSMQQGGKFEAAKAAVDAFLAAAPDDVRIGLVTFAGEVSTVIEPTIDHAADRGRPDLDHPQPRHERVRRDRRRSRRAGHGGLAVAAAALRRGGHGQ